MKSVLDPVLVEIMGDSGSDADHCRRLAKKLEKWAAELRLHAAAVSSRKKKPDDRFKSPSQFSNN